MRFRINKEIHNLSRSSKNVNFAEFHNDIFKLKKESPGSIKFHKSNKLIPSFSPQAVFPELSINLISSSDNNKYNYNKRNKFNFSIVSPNKNNILRLKYLYQQKEDSIIHRNALKKRFSLTDGHFKNKKLIYSSIMKAINRPINEHSSQTNLKMIQKELQFKLLDMSMAIENTNNIDDDNYFYNNKKPETKPLKNDINSNMKQSAILGNVSKCFHLNNLNGNLGLKNLNDSQNKGANNNKDFFHVTPFKLGQNNINIKNVRRQSCNVTRNNIFMNKNSRNSLLLNNNVINSYKRNSICFSQINSFVNIKKNLEFENKYRNLLRQKELYDSYEDEEVIENFEEEYFYINPETHKIFIFDTIILMCNMFCSFYYPLYIAKSTCFCSYIPKLINYILFFTDFIDIIDIIISFFRAYYNYEFTLIRKNKKIVRHYLKIFFIPDLIAAIPIFTFCNLLCGKNRPSDYYCFSNQLDFRHNLLKMCLGLKIIKIFKVVGKKTNRGINYYYEIISENFTLEKTMKMILFFIMCILAFNLFVCYHIYIGKQSYPNWILETNNQDASFLKLYIISCYFLITTITSVGYGDITCASFAETIYQIIILTIGVIAYSWIVSTIGNYVKNETKAAIKYNNNISILEEIRIAYPKMPFKLYNKVQKHLESVSHQEEKFDSNLLINNLPYTLKNQLMFIIYDNIIKKFTFFKECQNSDFIIRILTSLIPNTAKKGAFIVHEGELIDNIIFVKQGRLSLVASIDLENPLKSIENYLGKTFEDINDKMNTNIDNSMSMNKSRPNLRLRVENAQEKITSLLKGNDLNENSDIEGEIGKCDFEGEEFDAENYQFLHILDILKNENYGEVFMYMQKPSPLSLRVKSKYCQLYLLRKQEVMQISKAYPNVWKNIYYKSYHNMKSLKRLTKKIIIQYSRNNGLKYNSDNDLDFSKSENILSALGISNQGSENKIKFNLSEENLSSQTLPQSPEYPKKSCLKNKNKKVNGNITNLKNDKIINKRNALKEPKTIETINKNDFANQINGNQSEKKNTLANLIRKANSCSINTKKINNNNHDYRSVNNYSCMKAAKINSQNIPKNCGNSDNLQIIEKKKSHFNNNTSRLFRNYKSSRNNNIINFGSTKSLKNHQMNLANDEFSIFGRIYSNADVRSNSINNKKLYKKDSDDFFQNFKVTESNLNDTKIINNNKMEHIIQKELNKNDGGGDGDDENPKTIKNLSKQLMKKIQKKIIKRRKRKKLYKALVSKITDNLIRVNPNFNLNLNLNSSVNNSFIYGSKSDNNIQSGIMAQNNSIIMNDNYMTSDKAVVNDGLNTIKEQELLVIPESAEFDSYYYSSSKNSMASKESSSNSFNQKKMVELSISQNTNFSISCTYDNINKISEGNYSTDISLRKSVLKLISIYLKHKRKMNKLKNESFSVNKENSNKLLTISEITEKEKNKKDNSNKSETTPSKTKNKKDKDKDKIKDKGKTKEKNESINNKNKEEDKDKDKDKEKDKEEDVWAFLEDNINDEKEGLKYIFNNSKRNSKKDYCKTPKSSVTNKMMMNLALSKNESRFKKEDQFNILNDNKQQSKKNQNKKKSKPRKSVTLCNSKQIKKNFKKNERNQSNNVDAKSSSLDLSLYDSVKQQEKYFKNNYKTFKPKEKDLNKEEDSK